MKLVIKDVHYGLVPYGPGTGNRSIGITFDEAEGEYTYEPQKDDEGKVITDDPIYVAAAGILGDIIAKIKEKDLSLSWANYLLGREYVYFIGTCTAAPGHREVMAALLEGLSRMALQAQKASFEDIDPEHKLAEVKKQLHAPMPVWVGEPKYYTGRDTFYENFNLVLLKLPLNESPAFNQMTMVEVANHAFSVYILDVDDKNFDSQIKVLEDAYCSIDALALPPQRIYIIDSDGSTRIAQYALDKGYRLNRKMSYGPDYQLDF